MMDILQSYLCPKVPENVIFVNSKLIVAIIIIVAVMLALIMKIIQQKSNITALRSQYLRSEAAAVENEKTLIEIIDKLKADNTKLAKEKSDLSKELSDLSKELSNLERVNTEWSRDNSALKSQYLCSEAAAVETEKTLIEIIVKLKANNTKLTKEKSDLSKELSDLSMKLSNLERVNTEWPREMEKLGQNIFPRLIRLQEKFDQIGQAKVKSSNLGYGPKNESQNICQVEQENLVNTVGTSPLPRLERLQEKIDQIGQARVNSSNLGYGQSVEELGQVQNPVVFDFKVHNSMSEEPQVDHQINLYIPKSEEPQVEQQNLVNTVGTLPIDLAMRIPLIYDTYFNHEDLSPDAIENRCPKVEIQGDELGSYVLGEILGAGANGVVQKAIYLPTGDLVCVKKLNRYSHGQDNRSQIFEEARIMSFIQIQNINHAVQLFDIICCQKFIYLVLEYCAGGSLADYLMNQKTQIDKSTAWAKRLTVSLLDLHDLGIAHRDIKPDNILIRRDRETGAETLIFSDFGLSRFWFPGQPCEKGVFGTPCFMAPELEKGTRVHEFSPDFWALGATLYMIFSHGHCLPYNFNPFPEVHGSDHVRFHGKFPVEIRVMISSMLKANSAHRMSAVKKMIQDIFNVKRG